MDVHSANIELKLTSATDEGIISGVANVMEITDLGGDIIRAGAFTKSLQDHDGKFPIECDHGNGLMAEVGVGYFSIAGNELRLDRGELNLDAEDVKTIIYPRIKFRQQKGLPAGLSINYRIPKGKAKYTSDGRREITEISLRKVGIVDEPMNQHSFIESVKNASGESTSFLSIVQKMMIMTGVPNAESEAFADYVSMFENGMMYEQRSNAHAALNWVIDDILWNNESEDQKIAAVFAACRDHTKYMGDWATAMLVNQSQKNVDETDEQKAGRMLSATNEQMINDVITMLQSMLDKLSSEETSAREQLDIAHKALSSMKPENSTSAETKPPVEVKPDDDEELKTLFIHFADEMRKVYAKS